MATNEQISHISDWLSAALINDSAWLQNVDERERPKKLMKFATVGAIVAEADHAMRKAAQRLSNVTLVDGDEVLHRELEDGYYIVQLLTAAALDRESAMMQHCIGDGAYDKRVNRPDYVYLSLRSRSGKAHVTIEIRNGEVTQLYGKQNQTPIKAHLERLIPFLHSEKYDANRYASFYLGYVIDDTGQWHSLQALPAGLNVSGSLTLGKSFKGRLPKGLKVGGNLYLNDASITELPVDLEVEGVLTLPGAIDALPEGLKVGGGIHTTIIKSPTFPERISLGGDIYIHSQSVINLPEGFHVVGDLGLSGNSITALPAGLSVGENLKLDWSKIEHLPDGLRVGGDLILSNTPISVLPKGLTVGGSLSAYATRISALPEGLNVGKRLDLSFSPISCFPEGMKVGGDLDLSGTKITALPESLTVAGKLDVSSTSITFLPEGIIVGGYISLASTGITTLPESIADETVIYDEDGETTAAAFRKKHAAGYVKPVFQWVR